METEGNDNSIIPTGNKTSHNSHFNKVEAKTFR